MGFVLGGVGARFFAPLQGAAILAVLFLCLLCYHFGNKRKTILWYPLLLLLVMAGGYLHTRPQLYPPYQLSEEQHITLTATVATPIQNVYWEWGEDEYMLTLEHASYDGKQLDHGIYLFLSKEAFSAIAPVQPGDIITVSGPINPYRRESSRISALAEGVGYVMEAEDAVVAAKQKGMYPYTAQRLAGYMNTSIDTLFPQTKETVKGVLLGKTRGISDTLISAFRGTGVAHILAVSGLHVGFLTGLLMGLARMLRLKGRGTFFFVIPVLFLYCFVVGFSPSVVRATLMATFLLLSKLWGTKYDIWTSLAASALLLLIINPIYLHTVGFQLSFLAVMGIGGLAKLIRRLVHRLPNAIGESISISLAAQAGILPLSLSIFGYMNVLSVLFNVLLVPLAGIGAMVCFVAIFLHPLIAPLARLLAYIGEGLWMLMETAVVFFDQHLPGSFRLTLTSAVQVLLLYGILFSFSSVLHLTKRQRMLFAGVFFIAFLFSVIPAIIQA
ncbi:ComEC/Rec2 family competence protein [Eubacteriales bacterium OttesenSCG-928-M02]|nr:ComEC/Rec2 family competence protein [Eubacteriales bacterium OttesenSCG-928-M02]